MMELINQQLGPDFAAQVQKPTQIYTQQTHALGWQDAKAQAGVSIGIFGVKQQRNLNIAANQNIFWIKNHWGTDVSQRLNTALTQAFHNGDTTQQLAELIKEQFQGITKQSAAYWQGIAENTALRVRQLGRLQGYEAAGATGYRLLVVQDERTSDICRALAAEDKVYPLAPALEIRNKLLAMPLNNDDLDSAREYLKAVTPWVNDSQIIKVDNKPVGISGAHTPFPPFHWKCRTETEIVLD